MNFDEIIVDSRLTREEFFEKNKELIDKLVIPMDGKLFVEGIVHEEKKNLNFQGVYVLFENDKVFYIGSALPRSRSIKKRFSEHYGGHKSHSKILTYLMESRGITKEEAKDVFNNLYFIAFKYQSLEYLMIENTTGLINGAGNKKTK